MKRNYFLLNLVVVRIWFLDPVEELSQEKAVANENISLLNNPHVIADNSEDRAGTLKYVVIKVV